MCIKPLDTFIHHHSKQTRNQRNFLKYTTLKLSLKMKIKRISSRQWTYPTKPNQHSRRCWFSSPAHSSNEIIPEVLTAHGDRDEMVRGTADAAAKLSFKSDFGRSDIKAAISALCCDCGGRLDKWNVNKWLLQRVRRIPNKPAGRICCEGTRGH